MTRLPSRLVVPIGFAHRGARADAKENTATAFDLAVELGASGIESDVWLTADGALVLTHDGTVGMRRRPVASMPRAEFDDEILTLPELLARVPHLPVSIDVKTNEAMPVIYTWLASLNPVERERVYLCHPDWRFLAEWRAADDHVRLVHSTAIKAMVDGPERQAFQLFEAGIDAVNLRENEWTGGLVALFHRFERLCFGWDAQHVRIIRNLLHMGIDGVYSDHVSAMMATIRGEDVLEF